MIPSLYSAAGISRAVTICTMYILTVSTLNYEEAMTVMQYCRRVAGPNFGFRMQLKKYCRTILPEVTRHRYIYINYIFIFNRKERG